MSASVAVLGILRFPPERIADLLPSLRDLLTATRTHDGCIAYDAAIDPFDPGLVRFSELWPDRESLDRHLKAAHIEPWRVAARKVGILERDFTAYAIHGSFKV
jgi:quinol monooxygenase YgiN